MDNEVAPMHIPSHTIVLQEPNEYVEAPIPAESAREDPNLNLTVAVRRKAAKRTLPWDLAAGELDLVTPQPQAEDIPARKKPRLEEPFSVSTDEAARNTASPNVSVGLPPTAVDNDETNANADPVTDTQANAGASTRKTGRWTTDEDAELTRAVTNTSKKKHGKEYNFDWNDISALVPTRTRKQCWTRWHDVLDPSIALTAGRTGKWEEDEDNKLKYAIQTHGRKDWAAISALVPGRTKNQCNQRWHDVLDPSIGRGSRSTGKWSALEDSKLQDAVQSHGNKDWVAISLLVSGRTKKQCWGRWQYKKKHMDPNS